MNIGRINAKTKKANQNDKGKLDERYEHKLTVPSSVNQTQKKKPKNVIRQRKQPEGNVYRENGNKNASQVGSGGLRDEADV